jgi:dynein heavy chain
VLDDNKILTLANGERMPMTDNVKMMFEVETLVNASPATVSRAGIIYVSDTDLDWSPVVEGFIRKLKLTETQIDFLRKLIEKWMGSSSPENPGHLMDWMIREKGFSQVMSVPRVCMTTALCDLFRGLTDSSMKGYIDISTDTETRMEKIFLYCLSWTVGGLLETASRRKFDMRLRQIDESKLPKCAEGETIYEYFLQVENCEWFKWKAPKWTYPQGDKLDFSNLLVPTVDSARASYLITHMHKQKKAVCLVGGEGTAKTSTALMFFKTLDSSKMLVKRVNFSSATTPRMCQDSIDVELEKKGSKSFCPPGGKEMTVFFDDLSMPLVNAWGGMNLDDLQYYLDDN